MWKARNKADLIIEVWEKLDCESIGAFELEAIETVVRDVFGEGAVDAPMRIARSLADQGADLRHAEIMGLHIARASHRPYEDAFRSILYITDLKSALASIRSLEKLRRKYGSDNDREGLSLVRKTAIQGKDQARETAARKRVDPVARHENEEIAQWFVIWLETPGVFENWLALRQQSSDFRAKFGKVSD